MPWEMIGDYTYEEFLAFCDAIVKSNPQELVGRRFTPRQWRIVNSLISVQMLYNTHEITFEQWEAYRQVVRTRIDRDV